MGIQLSKPKSSRSNTVSPGNSSNHDEKSITDDHIYRLAIDQSGLIGSLYNARYDYLLETPPLNISSTPIALSKAAKNPEINIGTLEDKNLSDIIGIDRELCLSIYLKLVASNGISSLIKHSFTIEKYTRFLSYYYISQQIQSNNEQTTIKLKTIKKSTADTDVTHVVTAIKYGIHVIIVLQLTPKDESDLDQLLEKIKKQLTENTFHITTNDKDLFNQFTHMKVFSNIPDVARLKKLADVCEKITDIRSNSSQHHLIEYTLRPIRCFCPSYPKEKARFVSINQKHMDQIEPYLYQLSLLRTQWNISYNSEIKQLLEKYLKQSYEEFQQRDSTVEELYQGRKDQKKNLILQIRNGAIEQDSLSEPLIDTEDRRLLKEIRDVTENQNTLREKAQLIDSFTKQDIEYLNVKEFIIEDGINLKSIMKRIMHKSKQKIVYCFDDKLEKLNSSKWNDFYIKLINERENNSQLEFVYADFSYCSYQLSQMEILPSKEIRQLRKTSRTESTLDSTTLSSSKKHHSNKSNSSINNFINVLLLGESGVGKSTFINAIVNYLNFHTLEKAHSSEPIVLMPISFLLTVGNNFEERIIRFGNEDPNEDHHHPGQSVTQHCRSYVFTIGTRTKIRIIDTPGMGDTRGLDQDDLNMKHILSFINNLSHLNAICILLKPNESKLNVVLRSYFGRLLSFLGESVHHNIIFCFTNTRGTFFAPGNTAPLLKSMLDTYSFNDILFKKSNTFCFDSESFRYLIARKNRIKFDDYQKDEYKRSWITSVNETNRLIQYICNELKPCLQKSWMSIEHAQFQINRMIRPILETIKNTMRNIILFDKSSSKSLIKLCPSSVDRNSATCTKCSHSAILCGEFWIMCYDLHTLSDRCSQCECDFSRHFKVNYVLKYKLCDKEQKPTFHDMKRNLEQLTQIIIQFAYFYKYLVHIATENDPILSVLNRMIKEEKSICSQKGNQNLNANLYDNLKSFKNEYKEAWSMSISNPKPITLPEVYKLIKTASEIREISEQLSTIKQMEDIYMNEQEKLVQ
ncbi:unnamed protein product [Rotaria sordida]|uniref:G domain-containing protein n=1 Tax=Rotaria sordida TaxID=392033 RepID=A0A814RF16_9BILA|nr:unnamed protein product [Rotaria sordida]CAF4018558.1 unnamed protein product [Rotaria sordida]